MIFCKRQNCVVGEQLCEKYSINSRQCSLRSAKYFKSHSLTVRAVAFGSGQARLSRSTIVSQMPCARANGKEKDKCQKISDSLHCNTWCSACRAYCYLSRGASGGTQSLLGWTSLYRKK